MALSTSNENLIDSIPNLNDRLNILESSWNIVSPPNLVYLESLRDDDNPILRTLVISDTERTEWQALSDALTPVKDFLKNLTGPPGTTTLSIDQIAILANLANNTLHSNDPDWNEERVTEAELNAHINQTSGYPDHLLHHSHGNYSLIQQITDKGSGKIITDAERLNFQNMYDDYDFELPSGFNEIRTHIDNTGQTPTSIHHTHTNLTTLDNITTSRILADDVIKSLRIDDVMILWGEVTIDTLNWLRTGQSVSPDPEIIFQTPFDSPPSVSISISDNDNITRGGVVFGADVVTTVDKINLRLTNISTIDVHRKTLRVSWIAYGVKV